MSLPKIDSPIYNTFLPLSGKNIRFRPFLTKEQMILLMAKQSGDIYEMITALEQIATNCILEGVDEIKDLPLCDLEFFFIQLRSKSVMEQVQLAYICRNDVDGKKCNTKTILNVDLRMIDVKMPTEDKSLVQITPLIGVKLRYPKFDLTERLTELSEHPDDYNLALEIIGECVQTVFDGEEVFTNFTQQEIKEFLESLPVEKLEQIKSFLDDLPVIEHDLNFKCRKCGYEDIIQLRGIEDFFY